MPYQSLRPSVLKSGSCGNRQRFGQRLNVKKKIGKSFTQKIIAQTNSNFRNLLQYTSSFSTQVKSNLITVIQLKINNITPAICSV